MTIDWWSLGLQAVNVLILVWLLSRVFWRPVARAIAARRDAARDMLDAAKATQAEADSALADVKRSRAAIDAEREAILAEAAKAAEETTQKELADAHDAAEKVAAAARKAVDGEADAVRQGYVAQANELAVEIASKILTQLDSPTVRAAFFASLVEAISAMPENESAALAATATGIDLVSAVDLSDEEKTEIAKAVGHALGGSPKMTFVTDPELICGLEIRTAHFVLHNSWRSDLTGVLKDLKNAA